MAGELNIDVRDDDGNTTTVTIGPNQCYVVPQGPQLVHL